jgi:hypothetical protein
VGIMKVIFQFVKVIFRFMKVIFRFMKVIFQFMQVIFWFIKDIIYNANSGLPKFAPLLHALCSLKTMGVLATT